jgi:hypothetical protein
MATMDQSRIREHMPVVSSDGQQFATVDHLDAGGTIKLTKDDRGQHHWIPMDWVARVDQQVHLDRPGDQAMREWTSTPPAAAGQGTRGETGEAIPL